MKHLLPFLFLSVAALFQVHAQEKQPKVIPKGTWLIEASTPLLFVPQNPENVIPSTYMGLSTNQEVKWSIGATGGHFIKDNLALTLGLGAKSARYKRVFSDTPRILKQVSYRLGLRYYLRGKYPIQVDFSGISGKFGNSSTEFTDHQNYLGIQAGRSFFLHKKVALEMGVRYDHRIDASDVNNSINGYLAVSIFPNRKKH